MFGILFGTVCLIALVGMMRRRRRFGHGRFGHHGFGHGRFGNRGLRWLFWRLETTHGQEEVIRHAWEEMRETLAGARGAWRDMARGAGAAFASERFDHASANAVWQQQDATLVTVREAAAKFMERIHAVLDPQQRTQVARWLESAPRFGRC